MALLTSSLFLDFVIFFLSTVLFFYLYLKSKHNYWKNKGVPYVEPEMFFGSFKQNFKGKESIVDIHKKIYNELKGERFGGYYELHVPNLMIRDPELIQRIMVKDFNHFYDRGFFPVDPVADPLTYSMPNLEGHEWRVQRQQLSPTFSSGKLKGMLDQMYKCGDDLIEELEKFADTGKELEAKDVISIFTSDVIASCAFGLQFKVNSPEGLPFKNMSSNAFGRSRFAYTFMVLRAACFNLAKVFGIRTFSKPVTDYFLNLTSETVRYRKENNIKRNDYLQLLINLKEKSEGKLVKEDADDHEEDALVNQLQHTEPAKDQPKDSQTMTDEWLAANSFLFLVAGTEVSTATSITLYCLADNPEVQQCLQEELDRVMNNHKTLDYEALKEMTYMDQVIQESMRLYPVAGFGFRVCTKPYQIPDSNLVVEKGTRITFPVLSIQTDPQYYKDPYKFDPERFRDNNYKPSPTYLPFGDGPRICIGMRFALLEMKICLARVLSRFSVRLSGRTTGIKWDPLLVFPRPVGGIWLTFHSRK